MMNLVEFKRILVELELQIGLNNYQGCDPYDFLNSSLTDSLPAHKLKYYGTQTLKRFPVNIRRTLGIKKGYIPKGVALILKAKCSLARNNILLKENSIIADELYEVLLSLRSPKHDYFCWGLNYPYATKTKYVEAYSPSLVVTSFVSEALWAYYQLTKKEEVLDVIKSSAAFVDKCLPKFTTKYGESISYYAEEPDAVINANAHAAEMFSRLYFITKQEVYYEMAIKPLEFVLKTQKNEGFWNYRIHSDGSERSQIDFHQGNILDSLFNCREFLQERYYSEISNALDKGTNWYVNNQFEPNGATYYRYPKVWPKDIHHQAQGIYTLAHISNGKPELLGYSLKFADWAIKNMWNNKGYFNYRKNKWFVNKTNFMRWGQAWMYLAMTELLINLKQSQ